MSPSATKVTGHYFESVPVNYLRNSYEVPITSCTEPGFGRIYFSFKYIKDHPSQMYLKMSELVLVGGEPSRRFW